MGIDLFN